MERAEDGVYWNFLEGNKNDLDFSGVLKRPCKYLMRLPDVKRREHTPVAKHRGPGTKTPGAFLSNAMRWPGHGRTSGMRCVIGRAEHARDGVFCVFAEGVCSLKPAQLIRV